MLYAAGQDTSLLYIAEKIHSFLYGYIEKDRQENSMYCILVTSSYMMVFIGGGKLKKVGRMNIFVHSVTCKSKHF